MSTGTPPSGNAAKHTDVKFGVGFELEVGDHTLKLEPRALLSADDLKQGTIDVALPKDDTRDIGSFADFWTAFDKQIVDLPAIDWTGLPDPLDNLTTAHVTLREFEFKMVKAHLDHLLLDVTLQTAWKVPGLKEVTVESLSLIVDVSPQSPGGATVQAPPKKLAPPAAG